MKKVIITLLGVLLLPGCAQPSQSEQDATNVLKGAGIKIVDCPSDEDLGYTPADPRPAVQVCGEFEDGVDAIQARLHSLSSDVYTPTTEFGPSAGDFYGQSWRTHGGQGERMTVIYNPHTALVELSSLRNK